MTDAPHSALYLHDARDLYWNPDFLALVAARTQLASARRVLDVGAGLGHWTRTIARLLAPGAEVTGVDREQSWVDGARAAGDVDGVTLTYTRGDATALPFADGAFDVVTCQTVLIHVADPRAVVQEMLRVLRPGGRLLLAEPNNLASTMGRIVASPHFDVDTALAQFKLEAHCQKGKHALGLGYNSVGEGLVGPVDPGVIDDLHVWNNDKCAVFGPGEDRAGRAELHDERRRIESGALTWSKEETLRYFVAGGGDVDEFDALWRASLRAALAWLDGAFAGDVCVNEGALFYLLSARKR